MTVLSKLRGELICQQKLVQQWHAVNDQFWQSQLARRFEQTLAHCQGCYDMAWQAHFCIVHFILSQHS